MRGVGLFCITFVVTIILVLLAFLIGVLSTTGMAVAYIFLIFIGILVVSRIIKSSRLEEGFVRKPLTASPLSKTFLSTRALKIVIALSIGTLGYGVWSMQGEPLLPRITGIAVNICFTTAFIIALRKSKRNSKD
jgi:hypothetical protein